MLTGKLRPARAIGTFRSNRRPSADRDAAR